MAFGARRRTESDESQVSTTDPLKRKLDEGWEELQRIHTRVGIVLFTFGFLFGIIYDGIVCFLINEKHRCEVTFLAILTDLGMTAVWLGRILCFSLAPMAGDLRLTRVALVLDAGTMIFAAIQELRTNNPAFEIMIVPKVVLLMGVVPAILHRKADAMQEAMWHAVACYLAVGTLMSIGFETLTSMECRSFTPYIGSIFMRLGTLLFVLRSSRRLAVQAAVARMVNFRTTRRAAAGIAGLVGACSTKEALKEAKLRFRSVLLADLKEEDIADNTPDPRLLQRTSLANFMQNDAFVSHSWSDDSTSKWTALQRWRSAFVKEYRREPRIWFDKCCIDQTDIDADLRCLPVFLWGCRRLVVFFGDTYLSRLWCIMELFTFLHIGRSASELEFVPVSGSHQELDSSWILEAVRGFDVGKCSCYLEEDKEKMLRIIRTAFGSLRAFNRAARKTFREAVRHSGLVSHSGEDEDAYVSDEDTSDEARSADDTSSTGS